MTMFAPGAGGKKTPPGLMVNFACPCLWAGVNKISKSSSAKF